MSLKQLLSLAALASSAAAAALTVKCPDGSFVTNAACCAYPALKTDLLTNLFDEGCSEEVHETLRLAFHDAIGISSSLASSGQFPGGGADGSIMTFESVETNYPPNLGTSVSVDFLKPFLANHNVTAGDLIQFAAAVAITQCPGAPVLTFLSGRPTAKQVSPPGLVPQPSDSVTTILNRFSDAGGFTASQVVALLASHSIARSDHVDPTIEAVPFDTTPFTFDTQFFLETQLKGIGWPGTPNNVGEAESPYPLGSGEDVGEMRLQSDFAFARDSRTACTWQGFVTNQSMMANKFRIAMNKLALLGNNPNKMIDCSCALPPAPPKVKQSATFPAGTGPSDVQPACATTPFPTLSTDPGTESLIPHCPDGSMSDCDSSSS